jgi:hypothetical protein
LYVAKIVIRCLVVARLAREQQLAQAALLSIDSIDEQKEKIALIS